MIARSESPPPPTLLAFPSLLALLTLPAVSPTPLPATLVPGAAPAVTAPAPSAPAPSPDLEGRWEARMDGGDFPVLLRLALSPGDDGDPPWTGTFSVPAEGIVDLPIASVEVDGPEVSVALTPLRVFEGRRSGDAITGTLVFRDQGDRTFSLTFHREGSPGWEMLQREYEADRRAMEAVAAQNPPPALEPVERGPALDRVDPAALDSLLEAAAASHTTGLVLLRDGALVGVWHAGGTPGRIEAMSATKSVLSLAVGRLVTTGALASIDEPVHRFYPEWAEGPKAAITVRHLLNHTSGLDSPLPTGPIYASSDFVRFALDSELVTEPGAAVQYNNSATNLLAGVVGVAAGRPLDEYLRDALFAPLGIEDFGWTRDPSGNPHGMAGLQILPQDLARLGQLVLQRGVWDGEVLLDPDWIEQSLSPGSTLSERVGLLWWLEREEGRTVAARADGYLGQYLVVLPEEGLVGVRMIEQFPGYDESRDAFPEFQSMLRSLLP